MNRRTRWLLHLFSAFAALTALASASRASEPKREARPEQLESSKWWREQAVAFAGRISEPKQREQAHYELAYVRARAGDLPGAHASATLVAEPQLRIYALCFLAEQYHGKGEAKACQAELEQAQRVALQWNNNFGDSAVIQAYLKLGYTAEAVSFADGISDQPRHGYALQQIAAFLAQHGELDKANEIVEHHLSAGWQEATVARMANACAEQARTEEVETLAAKLAAPQRDRAYATLAGALAKAGRCDQARRFADRVVDPVGQATARGSIEARLAQDLSIADLRVRMAQAKSREEILALGSVLLDKLLKSGQAAEAEAAIDAMVRAIQSAPRPVEKSKFGHFDDAAAIAQVKLSYLKVARLLASKGDREGARSRIAQVQKVLADLPEHAGLVKMLAVSELVGAQIEVGDLGDALRHLSDIKDEFTRSSCASAVAVALIKSGDTKSGMEAARQITRPLGRGSAVGAVAVALIHAGDLPAAKKLLQELGDGPEDLLAFRAVATTLVELRRGTELRQWLGDMRSDAARTYACIGAAEAK